MQSTVATQQEQKHQFQRDSVLDPIVLPPKLENLNNHLGDTIRRSALRNSSTVAKHCRKAAAIPSQLCSRRRSRPALEPIGLPPPV